MAKLLGKTMELSGEAYHVPPLNLLAVEEHAELIQSMMTSASSASSRAVMMADLPKIGVLAHAALQRNYPDMTLADVKNIVDLENAGDLLLIIFAQSGVAEAGEAKALPASADQSTGQSSTPSSAQAPDGPGTTSAST